MRSGGQGLGGPALQTLTGEGPLRAEATASSYGTAGPSCPAGGGSAKGTLGRVGAFVAHNRFFKSKDEARMLAKLALSSAKADLKVTYSDLPALLMPWVIFTLCLLPAALLPELFINYLAIALSTFLTLGFQLLSRGRAWRMLALTCCVAFGLGEILGMYDRLKYLYPYHVYSRSPYHTNVLPSSRPDAYRDAGYIEFSADAHVEASRGLGYASRELWCVAPIVGAEHAALVNESAVPVGFWAVGQNCCQMRGLFECSDIGKPHSHAGLVVSDAGSMGQSLVSMYTLAAEAASQTYGLPMPEKPIFVRWGADPQDVLERMYGDAEDFSIFAVLIFLGLVPVFALSLSCLGLALTDREESPHWHPDKAAMMRFGFDWSERPYDDELTLGLLNMQCYWSGEVIYDYAFHTANKHLFVGWLFCHPAHPYSKWERFIILIIVSLFIVFPVAAFSLKFGQTGLTRTIMVAGLVTVPRNILKLYLIQISQDDAVMELEQGVRRESALTRSALAWEMTFLGGCLLAAVATAVVCTCYIKSTTSLPLSEVLMRNCDGLVFAFVLEPLFDIVSPFLGTGEYEGVWTLGFFGRWCMERDAVEAAAMQSTPGTLRDLEVERGRNRPRFRGVGSEIFFGSEARQRTSTTKQSL